MGSFRNSRKTWNLESETLNQRSERMASFRNFLITLEGRVTRVPDRFCTNGERISEDDTPENGVPNALKHIGTRVTRPSNVDVASFRIVEKHFFRPD
jgi:hypothetical protein